MRAGDEGREFLSVVQSDLAVNLFMILLIILSVQTFVSVAVTSKGYEVPYRNEIGQDLPLGLVRSWKPVLQTNTRFIVRDGRVSKVTTAAWARAFAAGERLVQDETGEDRARLALEDREASAYEARMLLYRSELPVQIVDYEVDLKDLSPESESESAKRLRADIEAHAAFDIFVYPDQSEVAWVLCKLLYDSRKTYRLIFWPRDGVFGFAYQANRFGLEGAYK